MESLLHWAIQHSDTTTPPTTSTLEAQARLRSLDPGIIETILGQPDAAKMRQSLALAQDQGRSRAERVQALDDLEMLVESLDNANDLAPLGLWKPLLGLLQSEEEEIRRAALWVAGTAVHNNPQSQSDFLALDPLPAVLGFVRDGEGETRARAVYALSGAVGHNPTAVGRMEELGGWRVLKNALEDPAPKVRVKVAFLLNTLLLLDTPQTQDQAHAYAHDTSVAPYPRAQKEFTTQTTKGRTRAAFKAEGIVDTLIEILSREGEEEEDLREKTGRCLLTFLEGGDDAWTGEQKETLRKALGVHSGGKLGLDQEEWERLTGSVR
ncbi:ARM repeat-containing protein [Dacryopinax primogenitus]|uniref:ARM repeat-containing protein n=1 Tax=Dacryopinax primogenitus (strain DJM 731) TaxID=1858805 RepID=M5GBL4_DACPD|nr:ARM repeat-containing protein [Dacryopinax primogenitus]EJU03452.1 ARM repeat-containing protein [Dacryopinax primogenitus]